MSHVALSERYRKTTFDEMRRVNISCCSLVGASLVAQRQVVKQRKKSCVSPCHAAEKESETRTHVEVVKSPKN